jgi:hypothetical protein
MRDVAGRVPMVGGGMASSGVVVAGVGGGRRVLIGHGSELAMRSGPRRRRDTVSCPAGV